MKKIVTPLLALMCVLGMAGCNTKSMNYIIENKSSVTGIVEEVHDDYIIICSETADGYPNGSNWSISLDVENKDSYTDVVVGDEIVFYYDGMAMETDPLQVSKVYAITLKTPADRTVDETVKETDIESSEEVIIGSDLIPMVMVNGELYMDTGHESTVEVRCGMMDGEITSTVVGTEQPTKDNESNFGTGYGYQYGSHEGLIEIYMNDKWWVFATPKALATSQRMIEINETESIIFHDKTFSKSDLSNETREWLEDYNSLSEEEQLTISSVPADLYELCGYSTAEETEAPAE